MGLDNFCIYVNKKFRKKIFVEKIQSTVLNKEDQFYFGKIYLLIRKFYNPNCEYFKFFK